MDLAKRLSKAKTGLILEHPFVGTVAMNMPIRLDPNMQSPYPGMPPTAMTNGKSITIHPDFIKDLTDEQLKFLVAHECFHPMLEHNYRRHDRNPRKWNRAADYVINQLLSDEGIGKFIDGGCLDPNIYKAGGGSADGIYNILPDQPEDSGGMGDGKDPFSGDLQDGEGTQSDKDQQAAEWKVRVAQAAQSARMMGKLSTNMERFVDQILNPKVDWRDVLQRFVEKCRTDMRSWARPNRRFIGQGFYLPSPDGEAMGELVFAIDCSGSVGADDLAQFAAEVTSVQEDHKPSKLHIVYFDSEVCHYDAFSRDDQVHISPHGGGGTAFSPVFDYLAENNISPVACVFLTDLYCSDFGVPQEYPVLWVSYGADEAPFGEVVKM